MIVRRCRVSWQRESVGLVRSRVPAWSVNRIVEVEYGRQEYDSVQIDVAQHGAQHRGARGPVGFTEEVFGRVPTVVLCQEAADEAFESMGILIDAPEGLLFFLILTLEAAEPRSGHIDKNQAGYIQKVLLIVYHRLRRGGLVFGIGRHHTAGPERSHMEPHRG